MKKSLFILLVILLTASFQKSRSQIDTSFLQTIVIGYDSTGWIHIDPAYQVKRDSLLPLFVSWFTFYAENDSFVLVKEIISDTSLISNIRHYKYQQYHRGFPVEGAEILEHTIND